MSAFVPPTRAAALDRLAAFVPQAGRAYAEGRNTDPGPDRPAAVSRLSPYLRYRLLGEDEVVAAVLARHSLQAADKFIAEVLWRTYWKGWLEQRPQVWQRYMDERAASRAALADSALLAAAESGTTGIDGFDHWARELVETGYLHNHARMWFASIWIFTLRLPWTLGADFFLLHLRDADAASNTLSWRWVAGLQTVGKTYLATRDNIARYTDGRFAPKGLAAEAVALSEEPVGKPLPLLPADRPAPGVPALLLVTSEDFLSGGLPGGDVPLAGALVVADDTLLWGEYARHWVGQAAADTSLRLRQQGLATEQSATLDSATLLAAAQACGARQVVTAWAPVGPVATALDAMAPALAAHGLPLARVRRAWDEAFWPHATRGFFPFKERIPETLRLLGIA